MADIWDRADNMTLEFALQVASAPALYTERAKEMALFTLGRQVRALVEAIKKEADHGVQEGAGREEAVTHG